IQLYETAPDNFPQGKPNSWEVGMHDSGATAAMYNAFVVCLDAGGRGITYPLTIAHGVPGMSSHKFRVTCPKGSIVIGGGVRGGDPARNFISESRPFDGSDVGKKPDDGWRSSVTNFSTDPVDM